MSSYSLAWTHSTVRVVPLVDVMQILLRRFFLRLLELLQNAALCDALRNGFDQLLALLLELGRVAGHFDQRRAARVERRLERRAEVLTHLREGVWDVEHPGRVLEGQSVR